MIGELKGGLELSVQSDYPILESALGSEKGREKGEERKALTMRPGRPPYDS